MKPRQDDTAAYLLVDGNMRFDALLDLDRTQAPCLFADDDEAFTYKKQVARLTPSM